tara:strand:+ start:412 stop:804 length:393 start_codon:yes stop_codon:yes gene_type:complete
MSTLITLSFSLIVICLTGWTITTYLVKENSKKFIKEELTNLLDICKMFFLSLKSLIGLLAKHSFSYSSIQENPFESLELEKKPLEVVDPIEAVETTGTIPSIETFEEDTELSSFSPELVEVINEEEEKVA